MCACGRLGFDPVGTGEGAHDATTDVDGDGAVVGPDGSMSPLTCADTDLGSAVGASVASGTLTNSDGDDFESCAGNHSPDRAFAWTAPADGQYTFSLCNSPDWDSVMYLYADTACSGMPMACHDDDCGQHERIRATLAAGQRVVIIIDGFLDRGAFVLDIQ